MIANKHFDPSPAVPHNLALLSDADLHKLDAALRDIFVALEQQLALWAQQLRTEYVANFHPVHQWRRDAIARRAGVTEERRPVRAEIQRRGLAQRGGSGRALAYPRLRDLAAALAGWPACPAEVRRAAAALQDALESVLDDRGDDDWPAWTPGNDPQGAPS